MLASRLTGGDAQIGGETGWLRAKAREVFPGDGTQELSHQQGESEVKRG